VYDESIFHQHSNIVADARSCQISWDVQAGEQKTRKVNTHPYRVYLRTIDRVTVGRWGTNWTVVFSVVGYDDSSGSLFFPDESAANQVVEALRRSVEFCRAEQ
jgi:hypothetical protein